MSALAIASCLNANFTAINRLLQEHSGCDLTYREIMEFYQSFFRHMLGIQIHISSHTIFPLISGGGGAY